MTRAGTLAALRRALADTEADIARHERRLRELVEERDQIARVLDAERRVRATIVERSNLERFAEIVGTGADPVKAALIVREEEEAS